MLEMFIYETVQLLEKLEEITIRSEQTKAYSPEELNELFRVMHTIKGSAAMMEYQQISRLAHSLEDLFHFIREEKPVEIDFSALTDLILKGKDFIKRQLTGFEAGTDHEEDSEVLVAEIRSFLEDLKNPKTLPEETGDPAPESDAPEQEESLGIWGENRRYKVVVFFDEDCQMEEVRAYALLHQIKDLVSDISYLPWDITDGSNAREIIQKEGFTIFFRTENPEAVHQRLLATSFLKSLSFEAVDKQESNPEVLPEEEPVKTGPAVQEADKVEQQKDEQHRDDHSVAAGKPRQQSFISVSITKLDELLNLVGEMVIAEAMVVQNPDLKDLRLDNFEKSARQLNKITSEIQDIVMSIRMVPLSATFHQLNRIVRDMSRKLNKEIQLEIIGEETEVDKNVIEHISDPLIHLIRNAIDHGIETPAERAAAGKQACGKITLEAKNAGGDVLIIIKDDGRGLDRDTILKKAKERGLIPQNNKELSDQEIFNLILLPGFSTKDKVSEYSGRGVGMDVVKKNIERIGGSVTVVSKPGQGTMFVLKIPLTLAIIDGINIKVGKTCFTIPTIGIRSIFMPPKHDITIDPDGNELIMLRGECHPILRLHQFYKVQTEKTDFSAGIFIMVEQDGKTACLFADELLGQQQVVIKSLPNYVRQLKQLRGIAGCTLLGDGSISLVLDLSGLLDAFIAS